MKLSFDELKRRKATLARGEEHKVYRLGDLLKEIDEERQHSSPSSWKAITLALIATGALAFLSLQTLGLLSVFPRQKQLSKIPTTLKSDVGVVTAENDPRNIRIPGTGKNDDWAPGPGWSLAWADDFNGNSIDTNSWTYDLGGGGWGNNELQTYTSSPDNSYLQNGALVIKGTQTNGKYRSARLKTQGLHSWQFGKIAARMRLPYGQGVWPAFLMVGTNITTVGWPKCGEIDVIEMVEGGKKRDDTIYATIQWDQNGSHASVTSGPFKLPDPNFFYENYHVFEIEWNPTEIIWRLDSQEYFRASVDPALNPNFQEFHAPFFIILNVAVGGNWLGNPNRNTVFPQYMYVDWVRVYQWGES